jgi:TolB protein
MLLLVVRAACGLLLASGVLLGIATVTDLPPGDEIAFVMLDDEGHNIYLHSVAHGVTARITHHGDVSLSTPIVWAPVGRTLAYVRMSEGNREIILLSPLKGERALRAHGIIVGDIAWAPDGEQLVYAPIRGRRRFVQSIDITTGTTSRLGDLTEGQAVSWSPDGRWVVFKRTDGRGDVIGVEMGTNMTRPLVTFSSASDVLQSSNTWPVSWSPDGTHFTLHATTRYDERLRETIYIVALETLALERVTESDEIAWGPQWSPDGSRIAYTRSQGTGPSIVNVADVDGDRDRALLPGRSPRWSPDGAYLSVVTALTDPGLTIVRADGGRSRRIVDGVVYSAVWRP